MLGDGRVHGVEGTADWNALGVAGKSAPIALPCDDKPLPRNRLSTACIVTDLEPPSAVE